MVPHQLSIVADSRFWAAAALAVREFADRLGASPRELQSITWLVPSAAQAVLAKQGLREAMQGAAFIPPRIAPVMSWLGRPLHSGIAARAELFAALRGNAWVRQSFGDAPAALWALARGMAQLCDELTLAAADQPDTFAERLQAGLARHFHRRAARALQPQAQLALQIWRARRSDDDVAQSLQELDARAERASSPLVFVAATLADANAAAWTRFVRRYAQRAPVLLLEADVAAALAQRPLLAAAWPELAGGDVDTPIAARAAAVGSAAPPLAIVEADSLEDEAAAVAQQVLDWRRAGVRSIMLVALDRLTARRTRALLERAQVSVRDETGWKLSTTSAAAAVMRWFDLVADDLYWRDLLDWLKSKFTLADRARKAGEIAFFERAIRAGGALQGARAIRRALADAACDQKASEVAGARDVLALIEAQALQTRRAGPTLAAHLRALSAALDALGMRAALAADAVGAQVLHEMDTLQHELADVSGRASLADFRALLAERFEEADYVDRQVDSPVAMVSLAAAALRPVDAALLIGADARNLPRAAPSSLFMSNAVRAELGLATVEVELRRQAEQLAALLATVPRVVATWRRRHDDEPNTLSPLLERLRFVVRRCGAGDLRATIARQAFDIAGEPLQRPAPSAPQLLPARLSASQCQSLVNCAYQFYARRLLHLIELDDVIEVPDKRDFGEALHEVLKRFHHEWGAAEFHRLDAGQLAASLSAHARAVFDPQIERTPALLAFKRRFDGLVGGYLQWLGEQSSYGWRWRGGEIERNEPISLRDGRAIELTGRIDRIDADEDRVRLLDYKARAVDALKSGLKTPGEDIQLPFYGLLLGGAESAAYVSFERAREVDGGVETVAPPQPFPALVRAVGARLHGDLQRLADGAAMPAIGVDAVCRYCEMRGLCRRDYWEHGDDVAADEFMAAVAASGDA